MDPIEILCHHFQYINPEMQMSILATAEQYMIMFAGYLSTTEIVDTDLPIIKLIRRDVNRLCNLLIGEPTSVVRVCEMFLHVLRGNPDDVENIQRVRTQIMFRISNFTHVLIHALNVPFAAVNGLVEFQNRHILFQLLELLYQFLLDNEKNHIDFIMFITGESMFYFIILTSIAQKYTPIIYNLLFDETLIQQTLRVLNIIIINDQTQRWSFIIADVIDLLANWSNQYKEVQIDWILSNMP